jgi:hypothetical protein
VTAGPAHTKQALLERVIAQYLDSRDFNGLYLGSKDASWRRAAQGLIRAGDVEVIDESIFPNPHLRPWHSPRTVDDQIASLEAGLTGTTYGLCLYPMPQVLLGNAAIDSLNQEPYRQRMARGGTSLELAYFRFDVLEAYRNDPTFSFDFEDFGAHITVTDEVYVDEAAAADDKIMLRLGFSYEQPLDLGGPIIRRACVFLGDLMKLTPVHQQRWQTYEVASDALKPHPVWWMMQMGEWPDGMGPFDGLIYELKTWDELHAQAFNGIRLLKTTERPREFGWIIRPSQQEYDEFIQLLDKLLSENLKHDAFDSAGVPRRDDQGSDLGTLTRLNLFLERAKVVEEHRKTVLRPLREVRSARQKPAHAIRTNLTDANFVRRQAELMQDVQASIRQLRWFWETHPLNKDWSEPDHMKNMTQYWL